MQTQRITARVDHLRAALRRLPPGARGRPERADGGARRRRLRPARLLRRRVRHPAHRPGRGRRAALQPLPRHLGVLCDPGRAAHRAQPPRGRDGRDRGGCARVPRLHRPDPALGGDAGPGAARPGVQHDGGRQVAPDAEGRVLVGRPVRALAAGHGLRALLRLPRGRDQPVGTRAGPRQHPHRAAADPGGGLPPHRGPGRPGDPDDPGPAAGRVPQAVLLLPRDRCRARAPPGAARSGWSPTSGSSTTGGRRGGSAPTTGRSPRASSRSTPPSPSGRRGCRSGRRCRPTSAGCSRATWRSSPAS